MTSNSNFRSKWKNPYYLTTGAAGRTPKPIMIRVFQEEWDAFVQACSDEGVTMAHVIWAMARAFTEATSADREKILRGERAPNRVQR